MWFLSPVARPTLISGMISVITKVSVTFVTHATPGLGEIKLILSYWPYGVVSHSEAVYNDTVHKREHFQSLLRNI